MFELFKRRNFNDYISDTFDFFKSNGKHFFKNYFTICGGLLLVLVVMTSFFVKVYTGFLFSFDRYQNNNNLLIDYITNNGVWIFLGVVFTALLMFLLHVLNFSVPTIYLNLYSKNNNQSFETKDIIAALKTNFSRILLFFLGLLFVFTPLLLVVFGLIVYLLLKIMGVPVIILFAIPILLFLIPTIFCVVTLSFYEFLNERKNFLSALGSGFKHIRNQYFPIVGSVMILYLVIQVTMGIFTMIPYSIGIASVVTNPNPSSTEGLSTISIMMMVVMIIAMLVSFILNNLLMINQGLVYYSRKEYDENISSQDSIDLIGSE